MIRTIEFCDVSNLDKKEAYWLHMFRHNTINDPTMWLKKPNKKIKENPNERNKIRIKNIKECREEYKSKVQIVLNSENWRTWNYKTKLSLITKITKLKLDRRTISKIKQRIIKNLKDENIIVKYRYTINLLWSPNINCRLLLKWIKNKIRKEVADEPLAEYLCATTEIKTIKAMTLQQLISNRKKTIINNDRTCNCNKYDWKKNTDNHIHMKIEDLKSNEINNIVFKSLIRNKKMCSCPTFK